MPLSHYLRLNAIENNLCLTRERDPLKANQRCLKDAVRASLVAVGDAAARQIIGRHLYAHAITHQDAYSVLAHLAGNRRQHDVRAVIQFDFKEGVGLLIDYRAFRGN